MERNKLERHILEKMVEHMELDDIDMGDFDYLAPIFLADEEDIPGLGLDSVDGLELVVIIHEEFGLKVAVEEMAKLRTIRAVADYLRENGIDEG